jgi:2-phosphosulfolactate phosphatase
MVQVVRRPLLEGARIAAGPTVVIDVFRAYSTAAYALAGGAARIVLAAELEEARSLAAAIPGAVLVGEEEGAKPEDFDLGNSPGEVMAAAAGLAGSTIVQRTSAGTRAARAALDGGAGPLYVASLVVAGATGRAVAGESQVTVVASGRYGIESAGEDEACADYLERLLTTGEPDAAVAVARARAGAGAQRLVASGWAHPDDLELCLAVDRFDFAMPARVTPAGLVEVNPV